MSNLYEFSVNGVAYFLVSILWAEDYTIQQGLTQRISYKTLLVCSCSTFINIASILHGAFAYLLM